MGSFLLVCISLLRRYTGLSSFLSLNVEHRPSRHNTKHTHRKYIGKWRGVLTGMKRDHSITYRKSQNLYTQIFYHKKYPLGNSIIHIIFLALSNFSLRFQQNCQKNTEGEKERLLPSVSSDCQHKAIYKKYAFCCIHFFQDTKCLVVEASLSFE